MNIDVLVEEIKKKGISRYKIHKETGVSQSTIGRILTKKNKPNNSTITLIWNYVFRKNNFKSKQSTEDKTIVAETKSNVENNGSIPPTEDEIERFLEILLLHEDHYKNTEIYTDFEKFIRMDERKLFLKEILLKKLNQEDK